MATLPTSERFFAPEITKIWFVPTIEAADLAYTLVERDAGTDLSGEVADIAGWQVTGGDIPTPDIASRFTSSIPGRQTADASSLTFYADLAGQDVRTVLTEGLNGFVIIADGGDVEGQPSDVFPVRVNTVGKVRSVGDAAHQLTVGFTITRKPAADVEIPAA